MPGKAALFLGQYQRKLSITRTVLAVPCTFEDSVMSIPCFSRDLISESLDLADDDHKKGSFPMISSGRLLTNGHHDPVVQMLPDHVNFAKSRVAQRCLVNIYQGTRGTRFGAEATRTFREERLHAWLTPKLIPPLLPIFLLRCARLSSPLRMPVLCDRVEARQMRGKPQAIPIEENSTRANEDS